MLYRLSGREYRWGRASLYKRHQFHCSGKIGRAFSRGWYLLQNEKSTCREACVLTMSSNRRPSLPRPPLHFHLQHHESTALKSYDSQVGVLVGIYAIFHFHVLSDQTIIQWLSSLPIFRPAT